jgi:hypothetical protein
MANESMRLTFSYDGDDVQLLSRQKVAMIPPPSDPTDELNNANGFWLDVKDTSGITLYRRVMHPAVRTDSEVFSNDPAQTIHRTPIDEPKGTFTIVIPNISGADSLSLHRGLAKPLGAVLGGSPESDAVQTSTVLSTFKLADDE